MLCTSPDYEIRKYSSTVVTEVTYDLAQLPDDRDNSFMILTNYISVVGEPLNVKPEKIAMTAPIITVVGKSMLTMQFGLASKYSIAEAVPKPLDERVVNHDTGGGERKYEAVRFSGVETDKVLEEKVGKVKWSLERDGYMVV